MFFRATPINASANGSSSVNQSLNATSLSSQPHLTQAQPKPIPAQPSSAQPSSAQPSSAQPSSAQPSSSQPSSAQPTETTQEWGGTDGVDGVETVSGWGGVEAVSGWGGTDSAGRAEAVSGWSGTSETGEWGAPEPNGANTNFDSNSETKALPIYVTSLPTNVSEADIKKLFEVYGKIDRVKKIPNCRYCYIYFVTQASVEAAVRASEDGIFMGKQKLYVDRRPVRLRPRLQPRQNMTRVETRPIRVSSAKAMKKAPAKGQAKGQEMRKSKSKGQEKSKSKVKTSKASRTTKPLKTNTLPKGFEAMAGVVAGYSFLDDGLGEFTQVTRSRKGLGSKEKSRGRDISKRRG